MTSAFDHIVMGADDLDAGAQWARETFGVEIPFGGAHPLMGTHNLLARLPTGYLEILAIDRAAPGPERARWYGLDEAATQSRIAERPRAIAWVLSVPDLDAAVAEAGWPVGEILEVSRDDLDWRMTTPADGSVVEGVLPYLIEWPERLGRRPPVERMQDFGMALRELKLRHPDPSRIEALLETVAAHAACGAAGLALRVEEAEAAGIQATFTSERVTMTL